MAVLDRPITKVNAESSLEFKKPNMHNVIMVDDDVTSMQFVCDILESHFGKSENDSYEHMMEVHLTGGSNVGTFTKDIAETKINVIHSLASQQGFPFKLQSVEVK